MGLKLRVAAGALLSLADVGSDLYMIIQFLQTGDTAAAYGMIGTVAVNLMLQTVLVVYQHKHRGWWAVGREVGFCVCFLKPGVDAFRVASGHLQTTGTPVDAMAEMTISKVVEMVTESTPSALLQTATALGSRTRSWATIGSIIFSCLATAFTALTIAWDFETHPMKRRNNPEFYGYLPDDPGRATVIFLLMFVIHATLVIGKIFAMALLVLPTMIKPEYIRTFVSLQSGCNYQMSTFHNNEDNHANRVRILFGNERKWKKIRPEVKQWVLDNYADWVSDQPSWFTEDVKARIPSDFIPSVHLIRAAPAAPPPNAQS